MSHRTPPKSFPALTTIILTTHVTTSFVAARPLRAPAPRRCVVLWKTGRPTQLARWATALIGSIVLFKRTCKPLRLSEFGWYLGPR